MRSLGRAASAAQNAAKKRGRYGRLIRVSSIHVRAVARSRKSTRIGSWSSSSLVTHPFYNKAHRFQRRNRTPATTPTRRQQQVDTASIRRKPTPLGRDFRIDRGRNGRYVGRYVFEQRSSRIRAA